MVSFSELMISEEQCNEQWKRFEVREFELKTEQIAAIINEYQNNGAANVYKTEYSHNNELYIDFLNQIQQLSLQSYESDVTLEQDVYVEKANKIWSKMEENCNNILTSIQFVFEMINEAQSILINKILGRWKREQIMFLYGEGGVSLPRTQNMIQNFEKLKFELYQIQAHFVQLFDFVWYLHTLVSILRNCHADRPDVDALANEIIFLQQKLLLSSFIVVEQPPQVIHSNVQ